MSTGSFPPSWAFSFFLQCFNIINAVSRPCQASSLMVYSERGHFLAFFLSISHYWQEEKLLILISHTHGSCLLVQRAFWELRASSVQHLLCKWRYFDVFLHYPGLIHSLFLSCGLAKTSRTDFAEHEWRSGICLLFPALVVSLDLPPVLRRVGDRLGRYLLCYVVMKGCCSLSKVFVDTLKTTTRLLFWSPLMWCLTCVH